MAAGVRCGRARPPRGGLRRTAGARGGGGEGEAGRRGRGIGMRIFKARADARPADPAMTETAARTAQRGSAAGKGGRRPGRSAARAAAARQSSAPWPTGRDGHAPPRPAPAASPRSQRRPTRRASLRPAARSRQSRAMTPAPLSSVPPIRRAATLFPSTPGHHGARNPIRRLFRRPEDGRRTATRRDRLARRSACAVPLFPAPTRWSRSSHGPSDPRRSAPGTRASAARRRPAAPPPRPRRARSRRRSGRSRAPP